MYQFFTNFSHVTIWIEFYKLSFSRRNSEIAAGS